METLDQATRVRRLKPPQNEVDLVIDTDAYNEVDDQFAIVHAVGSRHSVKAIHAAPFHNDRSTGPEDGMKKSYNEIGRVLDRLDVSCPRYRGAEQYMNNKNTPIQSAAVKDLIERANEPRDGPLYVVAIGAATNIASALVTAPAIKEDIVVVWLGGNPHDWPTAAEFNLSQDMIATRILFDSGVPLVHVPCALVAEGLRTTPSELHKIIDQGSQIGSFLTERVEDYEHQDGEAWSKPIWDLAATAYLVSPDAIESHLTHSPVLTEDETWSRDPDRHLARVIRRINRDTVFNNLTNIIDNLI